MKVSAVPRFRRVVKKLRSDEKAALDEAVRAVLDDPSIGEMKRGDLAGTQVYKYTHNRRLMLLAYRVIEDQGELRLLLLGTHENFYRDLKRG